MVLRCTNKLRIIFYKYLWEGKIAVVTSLITIWVFLLPLRFIGLYFRGFWLNLLNIPKTTKLPIEEPKLRRDSHSYDFFPSNTQL